VWAHLAAGVPLSELGTPISDVVRSPLPKPIRTDDGYLAHILLADVFGNLTTDLLAEWVKDAHNLTFTLRGHTIHGLVPSYGYAQAGELVALEDRRRLYRDCPSKWQRFKGSFRSH